MSLKNPKKPFANVKLNLWINYMVLHHIYVFFLNSDKKYFSLHILFWFEMHPVWWSNENSIFFLKNKNCYVSVLKRLGRHIAFLRQTTSYLINNEIILFSEHFVCTLPLKSSDLWSTYCNLSSSTCVGIKYSNSWELCVPVGWPGWTPGAHQSFSITSLPSWTGVRGKRKGSWVK